MTASNPIRRGIYVRFGKRWFDTAIASIALVALFPALAAIALLVLVIDGWPIFFLQRRSGLDGVTFDIWKFRTMTGQPAPGSVLVTAKCDVRITKLGQWLRRTKCDELPQLWNVLRGDMSFVGPRPIRPRFFEELAHDLPAYWQRLVVRPGLTGFAQVRRGYETSMAEKLAHDLEWIADRSVRLYLRTVIVTGVRVLRQVFTRRPRSRPLD